ncbi:MAG: hypothetical protein ACT4OJ_11880 [Bacteroidota bacterium]
MKTLLIILLLIAGTASGQKIMLDKTDPFNGTRTIGTDNLKIFPPFLQASSMATISGHDSSFYIGFIMELTYDVKLETADTIKKECLIKLTTGEVVTGTWKGDAELPIGTKIYTTSSFLFSDSDYKKIAAAGTSFIKITGVKVAGLFEIKEKDEDKISKLCRLILSVL